MTTLNPTEEVTQLALHLCQIYSVSGAEKELANAVYAALEKYPHLELLRDGDAVLARTNLGRERRVVIAGHLDTVPVDGNFPAEMRRVNGTDIVWGRGSVDMKSGVAVLFHLAALMDQPKHDVTWIFYDHEEVEAAKNGLGRLAKNHPDWLQGDLAILAEPTAAQIEGGCNGTLRVRVKLPGHAAHSARCWLGDNAVHRAAEVLTRLRDYRCDTVNVDGLDYRESLGAVWIEGGIAKNSVPDSCTVWVNYRFAPSKTVAQALSHVAELLAGIDCEIEVEDEAAGARPGLDQPLVQELIGCVLETSGTVGPKYGWTDVARFSALGVPAVNYGPGAPELCHTADENCPVEHIERCAQALRSFLSGS